jgi:hypothetical protein
MAVLQSVTATIAAGESLSSAADCSAGNRIARIIVPDIDPRTFASFEVIAPHAHAGVLTLPPTLGSAVAWVKLRSGCEGIPKPVPVDQTFSLIMEMPS